MSRRGKHTLLEKLRSFYLWHRYIGLAAALFILYLSITGILLSFTEELALDEHFVADRTLLSWYGIQAPQEIRGVSLDGIWVTRLGQQLFLNEKSISEQANLFIGAEITEDTVMIAFVNKVLLFARDGQLIEQIEDPLGSNTAITTIGRFADGKPGLSTEEATYTPDPLFLNWQSRELIGLKIRPLQPVPSPLKDVLSNAYMGATITWERALLDIHSGRLFGGIGVSLVILATALIIILVISGVVLWIKRLHSRRLHELQRTKKENLRTS